METEDATEKETEEEEKFLMDTLSERIIELKNSEQKYLNRVTNLDQALGQARADLIAVQARIDEVQRLINSQTESEPEKSG